MPHYPRGSKDLDKLLMFNTQWPHLPVSIKKRCSKVWKIWTIQQCGEGHSYIVHIVSPATGINLALHPMFLAQTLYPVYLLLRRGEIILLQAFCHIVDERAFVGSYTRAILCESIEIA